MSLKHINGMDYDFLKSVSQGSDGAQGAENRRIEEIADELRRLCQLYEAQPRTSHEDVTPFDREHIVSDYVAMCVQR